MLIFSAFCPAFPFGCATTGSKQTTQPTEPEQPQTKTKPPHKSGPHNFSGIHDNQGNRTFNFGNAPPKGETQGSHMDMGTTNFTKAVIRIINKKDETSKLLEIPIGGKKVALEPSEEKLMIQAISFYSDFAIGTMGPHSRSSELRNPALKVVITDGKKELFSGYLFGKFPDQHAFEHNKIKLKLVDVLK